MIKLPENCALFFFYVPPVKRSSFPFSFLPRPIKGGPSSPQVRLPLFSRYASARFQSPFVKVARSQAAVAVLFLSGGDTESTVRHPSRPSVPPLPSIKAPLCFPQPPRTSLPLSSRLLSRISVRVSLLRICTVVSTETVLLLPLFMVLFAFEAELGPFFKGSPVVFLPFAPAPPFAPSETPFRPSSWYTHRAADNLPLPRLFLFEHRC